jgi:hypothetical protein
MKAPNLGYEKEAASLTPELAQRLLLDSPPALLALVRLAPRSARATPSSRCRPSSATAITIASLWTSKPTYLFNVFMRLSPFEVVLVVVKFCGHNSAALRFTG